MRHIFLTALVSFLMLSPTVYAQEMPKPDDHVGFDLAAEDWVSTKTARVTVNVEAAVSAATAGTTRAEMVKAVGSIAGADWRLIGFNRSQDQTGMERWSASFEARLPEGNLSGLADNAKKQSKAGMQLTVADIDFSPTLDEVESTRSSLRAQIYKKAADQLTPLNTVLPGRSYRIASIEFTSDQTAMPMVRVLKNQPMAMSASIASDSEGNMERSEKLKIVAHVVLATAPTVGH